MSGLIEADARELRTLWNCVDAVDFVEMRCQCMCDGTVTAAHVEDCRLLRKFEQWNPRCALPVEQRDPTVVGWRITLGHSLFPPPLLRDIDELASLRLLH